MRDLLFAVPWWIPTLLVIIGLGVWVSGNRRQTLKVRQAGLLIMAVAVGWAVMSYLVDTPKETCQRRTRRLVQAAVDRDWNTLSNLLAPDVELTAAGNTAKVDGREVLVSTLKVDVNQIGLKSAVLTGIDAAEDQSGVIVSIHVFSDQELTMDRPIDSQWQLTWRETNGHWLLHEARAIQVANVPLEQLRGFLRKR